MQHCAKAMNCGHVLGTLFATLWLAGALLIVEHRGWLDGLDNLMFANAVAVSQARPAAPDPRGDTLTVKISRQFYETAFRERSPLDPLLLDRILQAVAASQPRQLAIDIDLSPSPSDVDLPGAAAARKSIAQTLKQMASQGTRVLLVMPGVSVTAAEQESRALWAGERCMDGVELADPSLGLSHTPAGISLLKYVTNLPSLGVLMGQAKPAHSAPAHEGQAKLRDLCASLKDNRMPLFMLAPSNVAGLLMNATESKDRLRINFKAFDSLRSLSLATNEDLDGLTQQLLSSSAKNLVLGGAYTEADTFSLPDGRTVTGSEIHAAVAFTRHNPVTVNHLWAYLLDLGLGLLIGLILKMLWDGYTHAQRLYAKGLCLALAVAALGGADLALIAAMPRLLQHDLWINATPLFIGLFFHAIMETLETEEAHHPADKESCLDALRAQVSWGLDRPWDAQLWLLLRWTLLSSGVYLVALSVFEH
jgi:hypothetical protein